MSAVPGGGVAKAIAFELPAALEADRPPEARGLTRDAARLLVARRGAATVEHHRFAELGAVLEPGDLVVLNDSATLPAAIDGRHDGHAVTVHVSTRVPGAGPGLRVVELRAERGRVPLTGRSGETVKLPRGVSLELLAPYVGSPRLHIARFALDRPLEAYLAEHGRPIAYRHVTGAWPLDAYQNVYARRPGSSEMASAGRPFSIPLLGRLVGCGVRVATLTLHAGVSSLERHEPPYPEPFAVPERTAEAVARTRREGGRVIAVGTTVVRALETVAESDGAVHAEEGWTSLVIGPERPLRVVDGLITGWHEPQASHLQLLSALAGESLLTRSYEEALRHGYLWHEFGDSHLILP